MTKVESKSKKTPATKKAAAVQKSLPEKKVKSNESASGAVSKTKRVSIEACKS